MRLLNWEKGARLSIPDGERVEIQPIGRGVTQDWLIVSKNLISVGRFYGRDV